MCNIILGKVVYNEYIQLNGEKNKWNGALMAGQKKWIKYFDPDTVAKLSHIGFMPSGLVEGSLVGNHRSPFHGFAIEFAGHRGYTPGDDTKHIDWKVYYRTGRYLMKQYEQETNMLCHIAVDVSSTMEFEYRNGRKRDYAAYMASSLAHIITSQSDSVNVHFFSDTLLYETMMTNSEDVVTKIANFYESADFSGKSSIGQTLSLLNESCMHRRVVFVISDFFDDMDSIFDGVKRLLGNHHEVVLLHVVDPLEISFDISGKVRLLEMEGAGRLDATGINIRESYETLFHAYLDEMKLRSMKLGIDYVLCNTSRSFGVTLAEYLSGKMFRVQSGGAGAVK